MALPILDAVSHGDTGGTSSTLTVSHTVTNANQNLILVVDLFTNGTLSTPTYAGSNLSLLTSNLTVWNVYRYYIKNPSTGTNNIIATSTTNYIGLCAASYYNAAQGTPWGTPSSSASGSAGNSSNSVTTTSTTQKVIDFNAAVAATSTTPSASQTQEVSDNFSAFPVMMALADINATGSSMTLTWTNVSNNSWVEISAALNLAIITISTSPTNLAFTSSGSQIVSITNTGNNGNEAWSVTKQNGSSWLSTSPSSDAALPQGNSDNVTVTVNTSGLAPGTYNDVLQFAVTGGTTVNVPVTLTVTTPFTNSPFGNPTPGAVVGPSIDNSPYPLPYRSRMGVRVAGRRISEYYGGRGRFGIGYKKKAWWQLW